MSSPSLFLAHGNPLNALAPNVFSNDWKTLLAGNKPLAVLVISAHWCTRGTSITSNTRPPTIHDFGGFPQALSICSTPAPVTRNWRQQGGPHARDAVPTMEHYLPLLYAAGAANDDEPVTMSSFKPTTLELASMRSIRFG